MMLQRSLLLVAALGLASCASTSATTYALGEAEPAPAPEAAPAVASATEIDALLQPHELSLAADLQAAGMMERRYPTSTQTRPRMRWAPGQVAMQGFFGAYEFTTISRSGGDTPPVDGSDDSLSSLPALGGGGQWKLAGDRIDIGLEAMLSFGWRANAAAFSTGGGGAVVAVDVDMFLFDLYGGPFLNIFLGDKVRVYGAIGPVMTWADYDQDGDNVNGGGSGFGTGWYTRAGAEFSVRPGLMLGGGVRWIDSTIDLDGGLGDMDLEGLQWAFTVTTGI